MPYCPECGGEMRYDSMLKRYICKSCGLSVTYEELSEMRDRVRDRPDSDEDEKKKRRKEYLDWWFSKKS
jgi:transposase-like protein